MLPSRTSTSAGKKKNGGSAIEKTPSRNDVVPYADNGDDGESMLNDAAVSDEDDLGSFFEGKKYFFSEEKTDDKGA